MNKEKSDSIWALFKTSVLADGLNQVWGEYVFVINRVLEERRPEFERFCDRQMTIPKDGREAEVVKITAQFRGWIMDEVARFEVWKTCNPQAQDKEFL